MAYISRVVSVAAPSSALVAAHPSTSSTASPVASCDTSSVPRRSQPAAADDRHRQRQRSSRLATSQAVLVSQTHVQGTLHRMNNKPTPRASPSARSSHPSGQRRPQRPESRMSRTGDGPRRTRVSLLTSFAPPVCHLRSATRGMVPAKTAPMTVPFDLRGRESPLARLTGAPRVR